MDTQHAPNEMMGLFLSRVEVNPLAAKRLGLTKTRLRILCFLIERPFVSKSAMIDHVWGDRADGGPDNPDKNICVHLTKIRRAIKHFGIEINALYGEGYFMSNEHRSLARLMLSDYQMEGAAS